MSAKTTETRPTVSPLCKRTITVCWARFTDGADSANDLAAGGPVFTMIRSLISSHFLAHSVTVPRVHRYPMLFQKSLQIGYHHSDGSSDPHVRNAVSRDNQSDVVFGEPCCPSCLLGGQGDSWSRLGNS